MCTTECIKKSLLQMSFSWYVNTKEKISKSTSARVKQLYLTRCYLMYYFALTSYHTTWKQRAYFEIFSKLKRILKDIFFKSILPLNRVNVTCRRSLTSFVSTLLCFKTVSYLRPTNFPWIPQSVNRTLQRAFIFIIYRICQCS